MIMDEYRILFEYFQRQHGPLPPRELRLMETFTLSASGHNTLLDAYGDTPVSDLARRLMFAIRPMAAQEMFKNREPMQWAVDIDTLMLDILKGLKDGTLPASSSTADRTSRIEIVSGLLSLYGEFEDGPERTRRLQERCTEFCAHLPDMARRVYQEALCAPSEALHGFLMDSLADSRLLNNRMLSRIPPEHLSQEDMFTVIDILLPDAVLDYLCEHYENMVQLDLEQHQAVLLKLLETSCSTLDDNQTLAFIDDSPEFLRYRDFIVDEAFIDQLIEVTRPTQRSVNCSFFYSEGVSVLSTLKAFASDIIEGPTSSTFELEDRVTRGLIADSQLLLPAVKILAEEASLSDASLHILCSLTGEVASKSKSYLNSILRNILLPQNLDIFTLPIDERRTVADRVPEWIDALTRRIRLPLPTIEKINELYDQQKLRALKSYSIDRERSTVNDIPDDEFALEGPAL